MQKTVKGLKDGKINIQDVHRVRELQTQNDELRAALKKKHPDSVLNMLSLITAGQIDQVPRSDLVKANEEVVQLKKKLNDKDIDFDRKLKALRAQYDKLKYDQETAELQAKLGK
jgi:hypothetical protein